MPIKARLQSLLARHPLGLQWSVPELFAQEVEFGPCRLYVIGLHSRRLDGAVVTGSAAEERDYPLERAFYELLERMAALDAAGKFTESFPLFDVSSPERAQLRFDQVFPMTVNSPLWRYSISNGVALHSLRECARESAIRELVERDRVLRAWFGGRPPERIETELFRGPLSGEVRSRYAAGAYAFEEEADPTGLRVVGVFCLPAEAELGRIPALCGFSAGRTLEEALHRAEAECLQRLAFLWGEELEKDPPFSPSPDYHQEFFLGPIGVERLRRWLAGELVNEEAQAKMSSLWSLAGSSIEVADITPANLRGSLTVAKAVSGQRLPLIFGDGYSRYLRLPEELRVHPIA